MNLLRIELQQPLSAAERADELRESAMVPVSCCDWLADALEAGVIKVARREAAFYLASGTQYWKIRCCPGCGEEFDSAQAPEPGRLPLKPARAVRTCSGCGGKLHDVRTCPEVAAERAANTEGEK